MTHVIGGLAVEHGGPSYSVPRLVTSLRAIGVDARLLSVGEGAAPPGLPDGTGLFPPSMSRVPFLNRLRVSNALRRELMATSRQTSVLHGHGLWLKPNLDTAAAARRAGVPLVVSPRGMLSAAALRFSRPQKALVWRLGQRAALARAACLHATSHGEYDDIRRAGLRVPVAVIGNGIDLPVLDSAVAERNTVLFLGRIHPKKGLAALVDAWTAVERQRPDWRLRIVGPDEDAHAAELMKRAAKAGLANVTVEGPLYGGDKADAFGRAGVLVLPSTNENFGLAAAEALSFAVPVIASRSTPWQGLETEAAGWWVDQAPASIAAAILDATGRPAAELAAMGKRGRAWMERDFGWDRVAAEMRDVYHWLAFGGPMPATVATA